MTVHYLPTVVSDSNIGARDAAANYARMCAARGDFLQAFREWLRSNPPADCAMIEADGSASALRQMVEMQGTRTSGR